MKRLALLVLILSTTAFGQKGSSLTVNITSPANGAVFGAPANITITATASEPGGTITQVQFFAGTTVIANIKKAPYSFTWSGVAAGSYALTAKATDSTGGTATSSTVNITVNGNQPPSVSITSPARGATFAASANIPIQATASDSDGTVTQVQFFAGTTQIGTVTTPPYSITWNNVAAGSYSLTARATDNAGATTTSSAVNITVGTAPVDQGFLDVATCSQIGGWAWDANQPNTAINVDIYDGNTLIATTAANLFRQDLLNAGIGNGNHAFNVTTPSSVVDGNPHTISAKFAGTSTSLSTSPKTVTCVSGGTIQGYKIDGNGAVFNSPGATITLDGGPQSFGPSVNPYTPSVTAGSHTVTSNTPPGFSVSYSACNNCTDHSAAGGHPFVAGTSVTVNVTSGGYVDLWWKYTAADAPPTASITSPASGATFTAPATVAIQATASDSDGTVSKVDFLANGTVIGTVTTAPYNFTWTNVAAGTYTLTARATDNAGLTGTSNAVTVNVGAAPVDFSTARVDPSN